MKNIKKKTIVGLIAIVGIASVVIFTGYIENDLSISPTSSFEVEYPITVYIETPPKPGSARITLYGDGLALIKEDGIVNYWEYKIKKKTSSHIIKFNDEDDANLIIFSNHDALFTDSNGRNTLFYWRCIEEDSPAFTPTPTPVSPTSSFEVEYPIIVCFDSGDVPTQIRLYEDNTAIIKYLHFDEPSYVKWKIKQKTVSKIRYLIGNEKCYFMDFTIFSNHDAILEAGTGNVLGHWR